MYIFDNDIKNPAVFSYMLTKAKLTRNVHLKEPVFFFYFLPFMLKVVTDLIRATDLY